MFILERVNGRLAFDGASGIFDSILVRTSTRTFDKENNAGANIDTAKEINITYIKTFDAALFSTKFLSLILTAVSSNKIAKFLKITR